MEYYARRGPTPKNYGGSYTPQEPETAEEQPRKFVLKEKTGGMLRYGMPLVDNFPRRTRKCADILRDSMLEMYRLATRLERKYYKKTTIEELDIELAVLKEFVVLASDKDYFRGGDTGADRSKGYAPPLTIHQRDVWSRYNKEIGALIGGYKKAFEKQAGK